ncbi:MAG: hypothetical protein ACON5A_05695 [Candidatus Comchoanobacterales bacterium]
MDYANTINTLKDISGFNTFISEITEDLTISKDLKESYILTCNQSIQVLVTFNQAKNMQEYNKVIKMLNIDGMSLTSAFKTHIISKCKKAIKLCQVLKELDSNTVHQRRERKATTIFCNKRKPKIKRKHKLSVGDQFKLKSKYTEGPHSTSNINTWGGNHTITALTDSYMEVDWLFNHSKRTYQYELNHFKKMMKCFVFTRANVTTQVESANKAKKHSIKRSELPPKKRYREDSYQAQGFAKIRSTTI